MWIDLYALRLEFPKGRAKEWLATKIAPFEVAGSAYWTDAARRATTDGIAIGDASEQTVTHILRHLGKVDIDIDVVKVHGSNLTGETETMGLVLGGVAAFAKAHAFGGRGVLFELGVQPPYSDDGDDLVHWLDDEGFHGARVLAEEALELRDRIKRFDLDTFDPHLYEAHPSGEDTEYPDDE
jgi:hypothetical protein